MRRGDFNMVSLEGLIDSSSETWREILEMRCSTKSISTGDKISFLLRDKDMITSSFPIHRNPFYHTLITFPTTVVL